MIFIVSIPVTSFEFEYSKQAISENNGISELPSLLPDYSLLSTPERLMH